MGPTVQQTLHRFRLAAHGLIVATLLLGAGIQVTHAAPEVRVKDLTVIEGVRSNPLLGYGLVVGLNGTGDGQQAQFTIQSLANMLQRTGIAIQPGAIRVKNVAAVMVTGELPPFARPSQRVDVVVSSIGDAQSLQGGTLLMTPLTGPDGQVYAVAQGPISLGGGFSAGGAGDNVTRNHQTAGSIPSGAVIERGAPLPIQGQERFRLLLHRPDFETADRIENALNGFFGGSIARAIDSGTVEVYPDAASAQDPVMLLARIESVAVRPDRSARVVVNERTGTIVMGEAVQLSSVVLAHGSLTIEISEEVQVSQPAALSDGETVVVPQREIYVDEGPNTILALEDALTVRDLAQALNSLGVTGRDIVAILQAIHSAGALHAELVIL